MLPVLTVSQFLLQINDIIAGQFVIEGEVSQYKVSQGKWIFFDLKDEAGVLGCFSTVFMIHQPLEDGMKVKITGYPKIYEKTGKFSFTAQSVELVGEGSLQKAYQLLKIKLQAEGLFAKERKRALPKFPQTVGVIASRDSAAFGDFKRILNNRWGGVEILLRHVNVQGDSAVGDIIQAFKEFNELEIIPDVLVLIRGGGSLEDLAAFNSEEVVRAVYSSRVPIVTGVGHERDETLVDFVADVRASTPSNAAEIVVPDKKDFFNELDNDIDRMEEVVKHSLTVQKHELNGASDSLERVLKLTFDNYSNYIHQAEILFDNVNPKRILGRGYSITRDAKGKIIKSAAQVDIGDKIMVELAKGNVGVNVTKIIEK